MKEKITKIINNWDPIGLKNIAPEDEYSCEVEEIIECLNQNKNIDVETLSMKIDEIFTKWFGEDVYHAKIEDVEKVAKAIIDVYELKI